AVQVTGESSQHVRGVLALLPPSPGGVTEVGGVDGVVEHAADLVMTPGRPATRVMIVTAGPGPEQARHGIPHPRHPTRPPLAAEAQSPARCASPHHTNPTAARHTAPLLTPKPTAIPIHH